jgi:adenosylcobinamide-GDP ribazoletransferase
LKNPFKKLALAASCVTSIPFLPSALSEDDLSGLSVYLPCVGILIGCLLNLLYFACRFLNAGAEITSFLVVCFWLVITGCIHLDGLMDAADGLFACTDRQRMLEIMKDSRVGNFGAIAGILLVLAKFVALATLPPAWIVAALFLLPAWARFVEVVAIACYPYARQSGMGKVWHDSTTAGDLFCAAALPGLFALLVSSLMHWQVILLAIPATVFPGLVCVHWVSLKLKGQTGDTYGASVEFSEAAGLMILCILARLI